MACHDPQAGESCVIVQIALHQAGHLAQPVIIPAETQHLAFAGWAGNFDGPVGRDCPGPDRTFEGETLTMRRDDRSARVGCAVVWETPDQHKMPGNQIEPPIRIFGLVTSQCKLSCAEKSKKQQSGTKHGRNWENG